MGKDAPHPEFDVLNCQGKQYHLWISDVENTLLRCNLLHIIIPSESSKPTSKSHKARALMFLRKHMDSSLQLQYKRIIDPEELWNTLKICFNKIHNTMLPELLSEWQNIRVIDYKSISDYNQAILELASRLLDCGVIKMDDDLIKKTLSTFSEAYYIIVKQY